MTETITHEDRKARKPYSCDYCGGRIEKGQVYHYYKGKYDGRFVRLFDKLEANPYYRAFKAL